MPDADYDALTEKTTIVDNDTFPLNDSAASQETKFYKGSTMKTYIGGDNFTQVPFPCVLEVPEGTVAYPDIHTLVTAGGKVSGFVMPNGASASTINFKCVAPVDFNATPAMKIRVRIMTLGAVAGPADVRMTVKTVGRADTESIDFAYTSETETTVTMPTATETLDYYTQDLTTDWAENDTIIGQIARDPTDGADDFTDDIMIVGVDLLVDLTAT